MKKVGKMGLRMVMPKEVDRGYVRRRAGAEWFFKDKLINPWTLIESIKEDFQVRISVEQAKELLIKYIACSNRTELEEQFMGAMRELAIENPKFASRLQTISIKQLEDI